MVLKSKLDVHTSRLKYHFDPAAWVLSDEFNAMKNCAGSNGGLATMPDEVSVRFIALFSLFDRTQRLGCGGKSVKSPEMPL